MRGALAILLTLIAAWATAERIILIPLDNRPAAGQFAQMIARTADVEVSMPPYELLGRFTDPGSPEAILDWLRKQSFDDVTAVVVSTDMIAYGSLVASRVLDVTQDEAIARLQTLVKIRREHPKVPFYAFSAIMRLAPTATRATAGWRMSLARYGEVKERLRQTGNPQYQATLRNLLAKIPPLEIQRYDDTRARNHAVQRELIKLVREGAFDYLIFGQDDAQPFGPHIPETQRLKAYVSQLSVDSRCYFTEGIDQHANVLVCRSLLKANGWTPRIRIVFSDEAGKNRIADYESKTIAQSVRDQIIASGARPALPNGDYDYSLYLNTPGRRDTPFKEFLSNLGNEIDQGFPVGVADINLAKDGTADPELYAGLRENNRIFRVLSYAGWNTAGNTMGTAIPAANVYLLARRLQRDPLRREIAQREFLLHRFVNDFSYHKFTRPAAYKMIDASPKASREETYGAEFEAVNEFVKQDLTQRLETAFDEQFKGRRFFAGSKEYELDGLAGVRVFLPWPRAYEVRLEFRLTAHPVDSNRQTSRRF